MIRDYKHLFQQALNKSPIDKWLAELVWLCKTTFVTNVQLLKCLLQWNEWSYSLVSIDTLCYQLIKAIPIIIVDSVSVKLLHKPENNQNFWKQSYRVVITVTIASSCLCMRINLFTVIIYFRLRMNEGYNVQGIYTCYKTKSIVYSLQTTLINYNSMNNTETGD